MSNDESHGPNPIDMHVGSRIRERRKELGMSQERLAEYLGLTFQQVQKYERGSNRVSASKLYEISQALKAQVSYFYEHMVVAGAGDALAESPSPDFRHDFIMTPEGMELAKAFPRITSRKVRRQVLEMVKTLAAEDDEDAMKHTRPSPDGTNGRAAQKEDLGPDFRPR